MNTRYYQAGAWCWILNGTGHTLGDIALRLSSNDSDSALNTALRNEPFELLGVERSEYTMTMGFSLATGLLLVTVGVLFSILLKVAAAAGEQTQRRIGIGALATSLAFLAFATAFFPPPPIILFALAGLAFAAAIWRRTPILARQR